MDYIMATDWLYDAMAQPQEQQQQQGTMEQQQASEAEKKKTAAEEEEKEQQQQQQQLNDQIEENEERLLRIVFEDDEEEEEKTLEEEEEDQTMIDKQQQPTANDNKINDEEDKENIPPTSPPEQLPKKCVCHRHPTIPVLDHLCQEFQCSLKELQVLLQNLEVRRKIVHHLRYNVLLRTNHLHPASRNFVVHSSDLTTQPVSTVPALGGYLGITVSSSSSSSINHNHKIIKDNLLFPFKVRAYYYLKHGLKLRHPYLPCVIEYGGARHRSFYPLEILMATKKDVEEEEKEKIFG
jgi:hypothetical protein